MFFFILHLVGEFVSACTIDKEQTRQSLHLCTCQYGWTWNWRDALDLFSSERNTLWGMIFQKKSTNLDSVPLFVFLYLVLTNSTKLGSIVRQAGLSTPTSISPESIWLRTETGRRSTSRSGRIARKAPRNWEHFDGDDDHGGDDDHDEDDNHAGDDKSFEDDGQSTMTMKNKMTMIMILTPNMFLIDWCW